MAFNIRQISQNVRGGLSALALIALLLTSLIATSAHAAPGDRTIYLYYTHTKETAKFTFKRGGRYDTKVLAKLNTFLRDWRRNEPTKMDPALFDLVWEVYNKAGASGPIHVVSAYRSPNTNEMLRSKSSGVAKNSRHTMGMAMDFYIPGVKISKLRTIAMSMQVGGVGYYPTSGSPFVHLDTGNVRAWPRMTRAQLKKVFPQGKTLHVPSDGVPLSKEGYQYAKAQWVKCHSVPCNGRTTTRATTQVANTDNNADRKNSGGTLLNWFFGAEEDEGAEESNVRVASARAPATPKIPTSAPTPFDRPVVAGIAPILLASNDTPFPAARPRVLTERATAEPLFDRKAGSIALAVAKTQTAPIPRALITAPQTRSDTIVTAYAPEIAPEPNAQRAVQKLLERTTEPAIVAAPKLDELPELQPIVPNTVAKETRNASVTGAGGDPLGSLIESTWTAVSHGGSVENAQNDTQVALKIALRRGRLHAPDLEHITEIFADPSPMSSKRYAVIFEHDEADFDPATELGQHTGKASLKRDAAWGLNSDKFLNVAPLLLAAR